MNEKLGVSIDQTNRAILFDLDETLFDRTESLKRFLEDQFEHAFPGTFSDIQSAIARFLELDDRGKRAKDQVYSTLLIEHDAGNPALAAELFDHYEENAWRFASGFDGMLDTLNELKSLGWRTGIISNGQTHIQLRTIFALNLDHLVDLYLVSEAVGMRKPEPEIFQLAADQLSVKVKDCIFVGDSPQADMAGAKAVGMMTVWFPNGAKWPEDQTDKPDAEIHSLLELVHVINGF